MAPRGTPGMAVGLSGSGIIDGVAQLIVNEVEWGRRRRVRARVRDSIGARSGKNQRGKDRIYIDCVSVRSKNWHTYLISYWLGQDVKTSKNKNDNVHGLR